MREAQDRKQKRELKESNHLFRPLDAEGSLGDSLSQVCKHVPRLKFALEFENSRGLMNRAVVFSFGLAKLFQLYVLCCS